MDNICKNLGPPYRPLSADALITQVIILNILDSLLTLYATRMGVVELNPIMDKLLSYGPVNFFLVKVISVTALVLLINRAVGHSGVPVYLFLAAVYWLVTAWHTFGVIYLYGVT